MTTASLVSTQLSRMRGMTAMYHRQFFRDINITTLLVMALFVVGWAGVTEAFLLIPPLALIGAVQTAFDSSYLIFARTYAATLEGYLNEHAGERVFVGSELEDTYLFELGTSKIVTIPIAGPFTWFSFVTIFYTVIGALAYAFGLALGWETLLEATPALAALYIVGVAGNTIAALVTGVWWFVGGVGERRLAAVLDERFGAQIGTPDA